MTEANYYDILGVMRTAPPEVIRAAYKALAQKYHPDRNNGDPESSEKMAALNKAIETLLDPEMRRAYDERLAADEPLTTEDVQEPDDEPHKPTNWYSGWRFWAITALGILSAKLIGALGTILAAVVFYWLRPKHGAVAALVVAAASGLAMSMVFSTILLPGSSGSQQQIVQQSKPITHDDSVSPIPNHSENPINSPQAQQTVAPPAQVSALPQRTPNYFDQFDNQSSPKTNPYIAKVRSLERARDAGSLSVIDVRPLAGSEVPLVPWPPTEVATVEQSQTWWVQVDEVWLHLINQSVRRIDTIKFTYIPKSCNDERSADAGHYLIRLQTPLPPGTDALVRFSRGNEFQLRDGCLTVIEILG
jgi:DnaJ-domain-containing protein 1